MNSKSKTKKYRIETDTLGERTLPQDAYYGVQTDRAIENFPISGLKSHPLFIDAFITIKKAAALANASLGALDPKRKTAIVTACNEILDGKFRDQFVVDIYQMGAGTSIHMNVNEVIANRANEILGGKRGVYDKVNPNDHVNMGQSTNDTYPTAMRISAIWVLNQYLHGPLLSLEATFFKKGEDFDKVLKSARTHLQDAVPIRLGQEFTAYAETIKRSHREIAYSISGLMEVGLGGSAAGTGLNTASGYAEKVAAELGKLTGLKIMPALDMREAMQSQRPISHMSACLRNLALELNRICNDLRLMSSGPTTGLAEIELPAVAPGSSIMPGKVNPSMLEMMNMVCYQVMGLDTTISYAVQAGQLELNVMMPLMSCNLNFMIMILGNAINVLHEKCIKGLKSNDKRCNEYANRSMGLATALNPHIGYAKSAEVAKEALRRGETLIEVASRKKILSKAEITKIMEPYAMTEPRKPKKGKK